MASVLSFALLFVMPVIVGYVIYKIITHDHESWKEECERMKDDVF